ncbi:MAG TPA: aminopeptidase, partial [Opitutaceae bacterium]|nr:aminopeptidase [Opitutaceae bacterium]
MFPGFDEQLRRYAEVIVRFGLNLRAGQRVLLTEPYELQGVARAAAPLVDAVAAAVANAGGGEVETLWGDEKAWRAAAGGDDAGEFAAQLARSTECVQTAIARGDALVFLVGVNPQLTDGVPLAGAARVRRRCGEAY